jgi:hypothetical protein
MVLRLTSRSPRRSGLFVTVVCASSRRLDAGVEASEPHDFAVRVSTIRPSRAARVHRIPHPTSVTIAKRPSVWDGMIRSIPVSTKRQSEIFLRQGLDSQIAKQPVGQITQQLKAISRKARPDHRVREGGHARHAQLQCRLGTSAVRPTALPATLAPCFYGLGKSSGSGRLHDGRASGAATGGSAK